MCHWELVAKERGIGGEWVIEEGVVRNPAESTQYVVSWAMERC